MYINHPEHVASFSDFVGEFVTDRTVVDYVDLTIYLNMPAKIYSIIGGGNLH